MSKLNTEFHNFTKHVEEIEVEGHSVVEFDMPYRALAFFGVPSRTSVLLQPTVHCLVNLTEPPHFVLSLDEIEIVNLERLPYLFLFFSKCIRVTKQGGYLLKNFDMVFVLKDYSKPVVHVNSIPMESLDTVRDWLEYVTFI